MKFILFCLCLVVAGEAFPQRYKSIKYIQNEQNNNNQDSEESGAAPLETKSDSAPYPPSGWKPKGARLVLPLPKIEYAKKYNGIYVYTPSTAEEVDTTTVSDIDVTSEEEIEDETVTTGFEIESTTANEEITTMDTEETNSKLDETLLKDVKLQKLVAEKISEDTTSVDESEDTITQSDDEMTTLSNDEVTTLANDEVTTLANDEVTTLANDPVTTESYDKTTDEEVVTLSDDEIAKPLQVEYERLETETTTMIGDSIENNSSDEKTTFSYDDSTTLSNDEESSTLPYETVYFNEGTTQSNEDKTEDTHSQTVQSERLENPELVEILPEQDVVESFDEIPDVVETLPDAVGPVNERGTYYVILPDSRIQRVFYTVNSDPQRRQFSSSLQTFGNQYLRGPLYLYTSQ